MPVRCGPPSSADTSAIGCATADGPRSDTAAIGSGPSTSSTRVFHAWHTVHWPAHFGNAAPQSLQR
jgi:hypothetical protein